MLTLWVLSESYRGLVTRLESGKSGDSQSGLIPWPLSVEARWQPVRGGQGPAPHGGEWERAIGSIADRVPFYSHANPVTVGLIICVLQMWFKDGFNYLSR